MLVEIGACDPGIHPSERCVLRPVPPNEGTPSRHLHRHIDPLLNILVYRVESNHALLLSSRFLAIDHFRTSNTEERKLVCHPRTSGPEDLLSWPSFNFCPVGLRASVINGISAPEDCGVVQIRNVSVNGSHQHDSSSTGTGSSSVAQWLQEFPHKRCECRKKTQPQVAPATSYILPLVAPFFEFLLLARTMSRGAKKYFGHTAV